MRKDFPILKKIIYFDNASTSQKPKTVITAITKFYTEENANVHRSVHKLAEIATLKYEETRKKTANFLGCKTNEIIFTSGTTHSLNLLANSKRAELESDDQILLTEMEHHSNIVPWQEICKETGSKLKFAEVNNNGVLDINNFEKLLNAHTKVVSITAMSNLTGIKNPIKKISELVRSKAPNAEIILDCAQSIVHEKPKINLVDYIVFSSHKMFGPMGLGILYANSNLLENLNPLMFGGEMINKVTKKETIFADPPQKFEAGTPNVASVIAFSKSLDYLEKNKEFIIKQDLKLLKYATSELKKIKGVEIFGDVQEKGPIISFALEGIHAHDLAQLLGEKNIAVRPGHMCAQPLINKANKDALTRISFLAYNTTKEIDVLIKSLKEIKCILKN
jgi:cysteine desulfurase/selenocysteine lyase